MKEKGPLTSVELAAELGVERHRADQTVYELKRKGKVRAVGDFKPKRYVTADAQVTASLASWRQPAGEPAQTFGSVTSLSVEAAPPVPAVVDPTPTPLTCGLLNSGELLIETQTDSLRLTRDQARALVDYLDMVSTALKAA